MYFTDLYAWEFFQGFVLDSGLVSHLNELIHDTVNKLITSSLSLLKSIPFHLIPISSTQQAVVSLTSYLS
jgi:hypothetical protein